MDANSKNDPYTQAVIQNLKDAGCEPDLITRFLSLDGSECAQQRLKFLSAHREFHLENVHLEEKRITCLDFLICQLNKSSQHRESIAALERSTPIK